MNNSDTTCPACDAYRRMPNRDYALQHLIDTCPTCKGTGRVAAPPASPVAQMWAEATQRYNDTQDQAEEMTREALGPAPDTQPGDERTIYRRSDLIEAAYANIGHGVDIEVIERVERFVIDLIIRERQAAYTQGRRDLVPELWEIGCELNNQGAEDWRATRRLWALHDRLATLQEKPKD